MALIRAVLVLASNKDHNCTHVSGITYSIDYAHSDDGQSGFVTAKAYLENGERIDLKKVYKVTINSYMALWADGHCLKMEDSGLSANDAEFKYLENHKDIDYQGVERYKMTVLN